MSDGVRSNLAIETEGLGRVYRSRKKRKADERVRVALSDVNLCVPRGELFGLLGPNGAGKTTLIKILTTLLAPSSGWAKVAGYDVIREAGSVRPCINMVSGGESSGYGLLTVRENLWMFAQFYGISSTEANRRILELLEVVKMSDRLNTRSSQLSTGLRQKMNIARGFLTDPKVLFLDEPTLGLDVEASRDARMGMMFASLFLLFGREGWHIVNLVQEPVYLLSGTYFPISSFNFWLAAGASIIPLTLALDAMRQLVFRAGEVPGFLAVNTELAVLAMLAVLFLLAARLSLTHMERLAIREGRLTESRA